MGVKLVIGSCGNPVYALEPAAPLALRVD
jgi:hypothetical protein